MPRFQWFFAGAVSLTAASTGRAAFIASLNGVSTSSTFENATTTSSASPIGWTAVGAEGIRAFKGSGGTNATMIAASDSLSAYTAQYDTGLSIQFETQYTLAVDIGFSVTLSQGSTANGFSISIGELSGGVFTPLSTQASSALYLYNENSQAPYYSLVAQTQLVNATFATGDDLAVQLSRTTPDATGWLGFDNVTLDATKVPEPGRSAGTLAAAGSLIRIARRKRRPSF